jgi:ATP-dependent DNA helicase RecG
MTKSLELLLKTPTKYEINFLSNSISHSNEAVLKVEVKDTNFRGKIVSIRLYCINLDISLEAIFFHFKPFMRRYFFAQNIIYIRGTIEIQNGYTKIIQPKIVDKIDSIVNIYKGLKQATKNKILAIKKDDLDTSFPSDILDNLLQIHHPTIKFAQDYNQTKQFDTPNLTALKYSEYYIYHQKLQKKRKDFKALKVLNSDDEMTKRFLSKLPFKLTNDQTKALEDIRVDFASNISSKRIIVGDVGSGKTILILACAYIAKQNNSRTILMAPTSVLVNQIYSEAMKYLSDDMNITLYTNKNKPKDELENYDFIIGTHAILYADLPSYELILVDEQHRFGTNQRASLDKLAQKNKKRAHYIQFSATPIPRTQALIESNLVDFSFLRQTPFIKDIDTKIITKKDFKDLLAHIKSEISQNRQIIIVYPLVNESEVIDYDYLSIL